MSWRTKVDCFSGQVFALAIVWYPPIELTGRYSCTTYITFFGNQRDFRKGALSW